MLITMNFKIIVFIIVLISILLTGCTGITDTDGDGYSDNADEFPSNSKYHAICPECLGSGFISTVKEKSVEFTSEGSYNNRGLFNPDYYMTVTVTNIDSNGGTFEVCSWAEDNGVKMWSETQKSYIAPGESHIFNFRYDADEDMDNFYHRVTPPTYVSKIENVCIICDGTGRI